MPIQTTTGMRGLTMIEMVITIVVLAIIFSLGAIMLGKSFESYDLTRKTTDTDWQGRVALERMVRELRNIRSATATDLAFSSTQIRFIDVDGNAVCFRQLGTNLQRSADGPTGTCGTTNAQPLADNVITNGLNFFYYQQDGAVAALATDVYYITATLQVTEGSINETYRMTVQPRAF